MRELFTLLSVALIAGATLAFTSCSKDDNEPKANKFTVDGTDHVINSIYVRDYGVNENSYAGHLTVICICAADDIVISISAFSTSGTALDKTTYKFNINSPRPVNTFSNSAWGVIDVSAAYFTSGTLKVKSAVGNRYEIEFSCEDENGKVVTGYYKGDIYFETADN